MVLYFCPSCQQPISSLSAAKRFSGAYDIFVCACCSQFSYYPPAPEPQGYPVALRAEVHSLDSPPSSVAVPVEASQPTIPVILQWCRENVLSLQAQVSALNDEMEHILYFHPREEVRKHKAVVEGKIAMLYLFQNFIEGK
jgi:hypothetical protein